MIYLILTEGFWIVGTIFASILCMCLLTQLGGFASSYAPKRSIKNSVLRALCLSIVMTIFVLLVILLIEYILAVASAKYGFFYGTLCILIVPILLIFLVIVFPQWLQSYKAKKWCKSHQTFCTLELHHVNSILFPSKLRIISPVSLDKIPIGASTEAIFTRNTLYILPGEHSIEFLVSRRLGMGLRSLPIPSVEKRMERTQLFKGGSCYTCKLKDQKNTVVIAYKGRRR